MPDALTTGTTGSTGPTDGFGSAGAIGVLLADGRLPTGGHAHSVGLEAAVRLGEVHDLATLSRFATARLETQGRVDAGFAAAATHAWRDIARTADRGEALDELIAEFDARTPSAHLREMARTLGRHLLRAARSVVADPERLAAVHPDTPRPIVAGVIAAEAGLSARYAAVVECHHLVSAICSGAVKLLGLDPLATVRIQAELAERIDRIADHVIADPATELPAAASSRAEILAEWHATDPGRLFAT